MAQWVKYLPCKPKNLRSHFSIHRKSVGSVALCLWYQHWRGREGILLTCWLASPEEISELQVQWELESVRGWHIHTHVNTHISMDYLKFSNSMSSQRKWFVCERTQCSKTKRKDKKNVSSNKSSREAHDALFGNVSDHTSSCNVNCLQLLCQRKLWIKEGNNKTLLSILS